MLNATQQSILVGAAEFRVSVLEPFDQRTAPAALAEVGAQLVLEIPWQRVGVRGAQQVERRVSLVARPQRVEFLAHRFERFVLVAVPVVSLHRHVLIGLSYALRSSVSAYCRCPLTWVSVKPVFAAISTRV